MILGARWPDGTPAAMTFLVWSHGKMYYVLSTRASDSASNGSVNLLIWSGMQHAHARGLAFDFDGVYSSGTARFLSGFNGSPKLRLVITRAGFCKCGAVHQAPVIWPPGIGKLHLVACIG